MCSSRPPLVPGQGWLVFPGSSRWQSLWGLWALLHVLSLGAYFAAQKIPHLCKPPPWLSYGSILHVTHLVVGKEIHFCVVQRYTRLLSVGEFPAEVDPASVQGQPQHKPWPPRGPFPRVGLPAQRVPAVLRPKWRRDEPPCGLEMLLEWQFYSILVA